MRVKEVTADLSDAMAVIVHTAFPNATLTLDCFHIMKRCNDAIEELRLRYRREAQAEQRRLELEHRKKDHAMIIQETYIASKNKTYICIVTDTLSRTRWLSIMCTWVSDANVFCSLFGHVVCV